MKNLFQIFITGLICNLSFHSIAQTVFATESFGTGSAAGTNANGFVGDMGTWTTANTGANGASANNWYVSGEECGMPVGNCGTACPGGNNTLHVSAIGGLCGSPDCGAAYDETFVSNQTNKRAISPTVDCAGYSNIELNFNYIAAQGDDGFWVEYSLDNGTSWTTFGGGILPESGCCCLLAGFCTNFFDPTPCSDLFSAQGYWTSANLVFPVGADNNSQVKFAFHWSNDGNGIGTDPSVAIDDITVTYGIILDNEISKFSVEPDGPINHLSWEAEKENDISTLIIQYSDNGKEFRDVGNFTKIDEITSNNNFVHQPTAQVNYYRLKTLKKTGESEFSETQKVSNEIDEIIVISENETFKVLGLDKYHGNIEVIDLSGKQQLNRTNFSFDETEVSIQNSSLSPGVYVINIHTSDRIFQKKVIKP